MVNSAIYNLKESRLDFVFFSILNGLKQKIFQGTFFKQFAEHIIDTAAQGFAGSLKFFQEAGIDFSLAGVFSDKIPKMADLNLTNPVNASEALFNFIGIPGQIVVDHQMPTLKVHTFSSGIVGNENQQVPVLHEPLHHLTPCLAGHTAMDDSNGIMPSQSRLDFLPQILQCVFGLREDDQLAAMAIGIKHQIIVKDPAELPPFGVFPRAQYSKGLLLKTFERLHLHIQLFQSLCRSDPSGDPPFKIINFLLAILINVV